MLETCVNLVSYCKKELYNLELRFREYWQIGLWFTLFYPWFSFVLFKLDVNCNFSLYAQLLATRDSDHEDMEEYNFTFERYIPHKPSNGDFSTTLLSVSEKLKTGKYLDLSCRNNNKFRVFHFS